MVLRNGISSKCRIHSIKCLKSISLWKIISPVLEVSSLIFWRNFVHAYCFVYHKMYQWCYVRFPFPHCGGALSQTGTNKGLGPMT
ncbi:hypothetical protein TNCV_3891161 [Trichonephila clavipes]|nr:hypothetical protein TNCV_3891161 [Trichonephila clavipes]